MSSAEKEQYVSRRISLLLSPTSSARDYRCFYRDTLFKVLLFIRRHLEGGTELLLSHDVFTSLVSCGRRCRNDPSVVGPMFHLCACLMHDKADYSKYVHRDMVEAFMSSGGLELALDVLGHETDSCEFQSRFAALLPVLLVAEVEEGLRWMREHLDDLVRPYREFSSKKDLLAYSADGERVKTNVMWERFSETLSQLYMEARGKLLNSGSPVGDQPAHGTNFALLQGTAVKRKSPPQSIRSCKTVGKKITVRPRAVPAMLQVTFNDDSRMPKKVRRTQQCLQRPEVKIIATKPMNVLEVMSRAPTVVPTALPLQGYANALKTNLPKPEPSFLLEEARPPRFKFTTEGVLSPRKTRDLSFPANAHKSSTDGYSSQPCSISADADNGLVRRAQSDPTLSSPKEKTGQKLKLAYLEPNAFGKSVLNESCELCRTHRTAQALLIPMETETSCEFSHKRAASDDDASSMEKEDEHDGRSLEGGNSSDSDHGDRWAIPGQSKHKLQCKKLHYFQEHLFREIQRVRKTEKKSDTALAAMILAETMLRSMNSLTLKPAYKANCSLDPRVVAQPLYTLDGGTRDLSTEQNDGEPSLSNDPACSPADGAWSGNFASVACREIAYDSKANLSSVWLSESQRWKNAFADVANAPLSSLVAANGFFYSERKKNFLAGVR
ncbi:hypothetical protein V5799_011182 [Amblyomma americanum]|uniref:Uncharacterized protein n=1 Tax=Amblyomma americanum TaxID=6943 RepID=A0AAQ4EHL2_AMBAM